MARVIELPELGVERPFAQKAVDALRGRTIEALDRIVEVVSGNTPHASSAPTRGMIAFFPRCVNAVLGKIFTHRSLQAAAAAFLLLAPLAGRADEVMFRRILEVAA